MILCTRLFRRKISQERNFRRRRLTEDKLLATPAGQISSDDLERAQNIMMRNAKRAEQLFFTDLKKSNYIYLTVTKKFLLIINFVSEIKIKWYSWKFIKFCVFQIQILSNLTSTSCFMKKKFYFPILEKRGRINTDNGKIF